MVKDRQDIDYLRERQKTAQEYNREMTKWILASLFLINGGPFALLSGKDFSNFSIFKVSALWFAGGLAMAILSGFSAWLNTGMREAIASIAIESALNDPENDGSVHSVIAKYSKTIRNSAYIGAIITGFGSLICFIIGAFTMAHFIK